MSANTLKRVLNFYKKKSPSNSHILFKKSSPRNKTQENLSFLTEHDSGSTATETIAKATNNSKNRNSAQAMVRKSKLESDTESNRGSLSSRFRMVLDLFVSKFVCDMKDCRKTCILENIELESKRIFNNNKPNLLPSSFSRSKTISTRNESEDFIKIYSSILGKSPSPKSQIYNINNKHRLLRSYEEDLQQQMLRVSKTRRGIENAISNDKVTIDFIKAIESLSHLARPKNEGIFLSKFANEFKELLTLYNSFDSPRFCFIRNEHLETLIQLIKLFKNENDLRAKDIEIMFGIYSELLNNGYGLTWDEYNTYLMLSSKLGLSTLSNNLRSLEKLENNLPNSMSNDKYLDSITRQIQNIKDLDYFETFLKEKKIKYMSDELIIKFMELYGKKRRIDKLIGTFKYLLKVGIKDKRVFKSTIDALINLGLYSSAKKMTLAALSLREVRDTQNPIIKSSTSQLVTDLVYNNIIPKHYILRKLSIESSDLVLLLKYLSNINGSHNEINLLLTILIGSGLSFNKHIFAYVLHNIYLYPVGWKKREVEDLIYELFENIDSINLNNSELKELKQIISVFELKTINRLDINDELSRLGCP